MTATIDNSVSTYTIQHGVQLLNSGPLGTDELIELSDPLVQSLIRLFNDTSICPTAESLPPIKRSFNEGIHKRADPLPVVEELTADVCTNPRLQRILDGLNPGWEFEALIPHADGDGLRDLGGAGAPNREDLELVVMQVDFVLGQQPYARYVCGFP